MPIVPIAVTSARCWPRKSFLLRPGVVDISIGRPIPSAGREPDELMREVEAWIEAEMRRLDPEAYRARAATQALESRAHAARAAPPRPCSCSLFDAAGAAAGTGRRPSRERRSASRPAPRSAGRSADAAAGDAFRHPRATARSRLGEHLVAYEFRRARRRSIGFVVGPEGLAVSAPRWVGVGDIEAALQEKAGWILRKLHEQHERAQPAGAGAHRLARRHHPALPGRDGDRGARPARHRRRAATAMPTPCPACRA